MSNWDSEFYNLDAYKDIIGKTLIDINESNDQIIFTCSDGSKYNMYHDQDCCESVSIDYVRVL